jgi:hypothetical protein
MPPGLVGIGTEVSSGWPSVTVHVIDTRQADDQIAGPAPVPAELSGAPSITSVSPYPVPLMESDDPAYTELKIYGERFREGQHVILNNGDVLGIELKTDYVSPQEVHAQLPRELWQHHGLSEKLVVKTPAGLCSVQVWEPE